MPTRKTREKYREAVRVYRDVWRMPLELPTGMVELECGSDIDALGTATARLESVAGQLETVAKSLRAGIKAAREQASCLRVPMEWTKSAESYARTMGGERVDELRSQAERIARESGVFLTGHRDKPGSTFIYRVTNEHVAKAYAWVNRKVK